MNKHTVTLAAIVAGVGAAGIIGAAGVSAATDSSGTSLASKLATTFHLNQADVQKVLDQDRAEHHAQMEADYKAKLDAAVKAGTITSAQETLILNKHKELEAAREANRNSTTDAATRHDKMKAEMDALKTWADQNKIPMNLLMPAGTGGHGGHGPDAPHAN